MQRPGAQVRGHHAVVHRTDSELLIASCSCGYRSPSFAGEAEACLVLMLHLQSAVRGGAQVLDDGDGLAGVREPRRPLPPHDHGTATRDTA